MGRRRKSGRGGDSESEDSQKTAKSDAAVQATTSLGLLIKAAGITQVTKSPRAQAAVPVKAQNAPIRAPVAPPPPTSFAELRMLNDAYAGTRPLSKKDARQVSMRPVVVRVTDEERAAEVAARKRIAALVSGGVHFKVKLEDDYVEGYRSEGSTKLLGRLAGKAFTPESTLDLHGQRTAQASDLVASFVRSHHRRGARQLLIIVGKGLHSQDGVGVLMPAVADALTQGLAAPLVRAFSSAHPNLGGRGAIAVLLI
jgi:DNA-nicking Smr family endonuclease